MLRADVFQAQQYQRGEWEEGRQEDEHERDEMEREDNLRRARRTPPQKHQASCAREERDHQDDEGLGDYSLATIEYVGVAQQRHGLVLELCGEQALRDWAQARAVQVHGQRYRQDA